MPTIDDWESNGQGNSSCGHGSAGWDIWSLVELELGAVQHPLGVALFVAPALGERFLAAFEAAQNHNNQALLDIEYVMPVQAATGR